MNSDIVYLAVGIVVWIVSTGCIWFREIGTGSLLESNDYVTVALIGLATGLLLGLAWPVTVVFGPIWVIVKKLADRERGA